MKIQPVCCVGWRPILCTVGLLFLAAASKADEPKRVALVVGNSNYESAPLKNPSNDVDTLARALKGLGFTVTTRKDVTKSQFENAVDEVTDGLAKGDACLIFYAGHGQGFENENYLVPIGAKLDRPQHVQDRCVSVSYLLRSLQYSDCSLKVVVVDACRNNPFRSFSRSTAGLSKIDEAPEGTIVSFSTSPRTPALDGIGNNSPYVKHLATAMRSQADQLEIVKLFRDVSQAVRRETGQRPFLDFDASMPYYYLKRRRDLVPDAPDMKTTPASRDQLRNSIGMDLRLIPAGEFLMGSPEGEEGRHDNEYQHPVKITQAFYLQTTEVTQGQWKSVMGTEPWKDKDNVKEGADYPATYVTHYDAVEFCRRLSTSEEGATYRLPTEAEWEYACRGGTSTIYSFGASAGELGQYAWFEENADDSGEEYAHRVGQKRPNGFGIYDMHGNVFEWCSDRYDAEYYRSSPGRDPTGPSSGSSPVFRGGCWFSSADGCRSALRSRGWPSDRGYSLGFRVARNSIN